MVSEVLAIRCGSDSSIVNERRKESVKPMDVYDEDSQVQSSGEVVIYFQL